jgi:2-phospho-L-lactate guanylyltransferase
MPPADVVVLIPVHALERAKSRLGEVLDAEERQDLAAGLLRRTIGAARGAGLDRIVVVSDDDAVCRLAEAAGATRVIAQRRPGLNAGLEEGRAAAIDDGAGALLVLPSDLPLADAASVRGLLAALGTAAGRAVVLVPDRHGRGTNALALRPPDVIPFAFGSDSRTAHRGLAHDAAARYVELESPLSVDLDTPDDLLLVEGRLGGGASRIVDEVG